MNGCISVEKNGFIKFRYRQDKKIKETFNLDEISAKLISQRNIELNELVISLIHS